MLNQSFTTENFRKIFDLENRKGNYLEGRFFPDVEKLTQKIKHKITDIRNLKKIKSSYDPEEYHSKLKDLYNEKDELKLKKETLLEKQLDKVSLQITQGGFEINLEQFTTPNGKTVYTVQNEPAAYFAVKQIQYNIKKLYKVKQSSRYNIISQLKALLDDKFPKYIIKTDIKEFYERIPRKSLLKIIDKDPLLTHSSKKIIKKILKKYEVSSGNTNGIPRGIGISAYLSELYMREFDRLLQKHEDVIYYARYVDDIVVVFSPKPNSNVDDYKNDVLDSSLDFGLILNESKTEEFYTKNENDFSFDYLGYKFQFEAGKLSVGMTDSKRERIKNRIKKCFSVYKKRAPYNEKLARRWLVKRVRYLTSNTRLHNSKGNVLIGIYYSNSLIDNLKDIKHLDECLKGCISTIGTPSAKERLKKYTFKNGFERKSFSRFKVKELEKITRLWKHES